MKHETPTNQWLLVLAVLICTISFILALFNKKKCHAIYALASISLCYIILILSGYTMSIVYLLTTLLVLATAGASDVLQIYNVPFDTILSGIVAVCTFIIFILLLSIPLNNHTFVSAKATSAEAPSIQWLIPLGLQFVYILAMKVVKGNRK